MIAVTIVLQPAYTLTLRGNIATSKKAQADCMTILSVLESGTRTY